MALTDDRFRNVLSAEVIMSAADTLTFAEVQTGASLGMRLGLVIDAIDFYPPASGYALMTTAGDAISMAWTTSDQVTDLNDEADSRIIHPVKIVRVDFGTAASAQLTHLPMHVEFTPPIIVASPKLFLAADSNGLASALTVRSRMAFRFISLNAQEYLEIAETFLHG